MEDVIIGLMRIYFTASLRGKKEYGQNYSEIVAVLNKLGHKVFSEHILNDNILDVGNLSKEDAKKNYARILSEIKKADVVVAEVSNQSLSVGHELTEAITLNKPLVVMYVGDKKPGLLFGSSYDKMQIIQYVFGEAEKVMEDVIANAIRHVDVRFNFFVSPKILSYLDWIVQKRMIPRSVFLRNLIDREMKKDREFKG